MKIISKDDGSCKFIFSEEEVNILNNTKQLTMPPEAFKNVINTMAKTLAECMHRFPEEVKKITSKEKEEIKTTE